jgi:hypothetical protein
VVGEVGGELDLQVEELLGYGLALGVEPERGGSPGAKSAGEQEVDGLDPGQLVPGHRIGAEVGEMVGHPIGVDLTEKHWIEIGMTGSDPDVDVRSLVSGPAVSNGHQRDGHGRACE